MHYKHCISPFEETFFFILTSSERAVCLKAVYIHWLKCWALTALTFFYIICYLFYIIFSIFSDICHFNFYKYVYLNHGICFSGTCIVLQLKKYGLPDLGQIVSYRQWTLFYSPSYPMLKCKSFFFCRTTINSFTQFTFCQEEALINEPLYL